MKLYASIRKRPSDGGSTAESKSVDISAEGDSYAEAYAALETQVPEDWQMLGISQWP